jgi:hypothetical protein
MELLQDRVKFRGFVKTIIKFRLPYKSGEYTDWLSKILKKTPDRGLFFFPSWTEILATCTDYMAPDEM